MNTREVVLVMCVVSKTSMLNVCECCGVMRDETSMAKKMAFVVVADCFHLFGSFFFFWLQGI